MNFSYIAKIFFYVNKNFLQIKKELDSAELTCVSLVKYYLKNIEEKKHLNAFVHVYADEALAQAEKIDEKLKNKTAGKLAGMVVGVKDVISQKGKTLTASSKILAGYNALYTATALQKLIDEDAIIIGSLNCDEFAMGSSNENSCYGPVLNPLDTTLVPGGSSGGSAVAVAADLCTVALGSDTGGSIRQPSSFCGTVGMKPTYGRISRYGLIAYASSFDQIGIFANTTYDAAIMIETMSGKDSMDATSSQLDLGELTTFTSNKKYKIAFYEETLNHPGLDTEIKNQTEKLLEKLKEDGHEIVAKKFQYLDYVVPAYYVLTTAEASSNLARFDGIRYGHRNEEAHNLEETYKYTRTSGFGKEVKRRILLGTFVLSSGYYDAYYTKAQQVRKLIHDETRQVLQECDFILMPTTPTTAFALGANTKDPIAMYLADIYTVQANIVGIPAISLPLCKHSNGLPFGIQILSDKNEEQKLFSFSDDMMKNYIYN